MDKIIKQYKNNHKIVEANVSHIKHLVDNLRKDDLKEVQCIYDDVRAVFHAALFMDDVTMTVLDKDDVPYAMFGAGKNQTENYIWMLGTDDVEKYKYFFTKHCKEWVDYFLKKYNKVYNYVHIENELAIKWLVWCGATFEEPIEINNNLFRRFTIKRRRK